MDPEKHFFVKSPMGEMIKVTTPEKVKIKKASVVLEKLADCETFCVSSNDSKNRTTRNETIPVHHNVRSEKSFPYTVEYRIESCTEREKHSESHSSKRKVKTYSNDPKVGTSREKIGHLYKSSDKSRSEKFINAFSNEGFSGNVKPAPSMNKSSMSIKHEDSFYISSYISKEQIMKSNVSHDLEMHSVEKKPQKSFITDIITTSQRVSSSARPDNSIPSRHSKISRQKEKPNYIQTNQSLIKFSDIKQHTNTTEGDAKPALQKLAVVGNMTKSEENQGSPLKEARAQFATKLSNITSSPIEIPPLDHGVMRVNRCKVTAVMLSQKSKITSSNISKEISCSKDKPQFTSNSKKEVSKEETPKHTIQLQRSIPSKGTSVSLNVVGKKDDSDVVPRDTETPTKASKKPLTKRYKNTRYSLPYRSSSIVIPKNYSVLDNTANTGYIHEATMSVTELPDMKQNTGDLMRRRYNKTGKITTVPILPKTTESLIQVSPGIHTMKTTKDLLNVMSIPVVERPTSDKMDNAGICPKTFSPRKCVSTSPIRVRGSCGEEQPLLTPGSPFYSIQSSKRFSELMAETNRLDSQMTTLHYSALMSYQQSPLKNVHQKFTKNKTERSFHRTQCAVVPQVTKESMPNNNAHANADVSRSSAGLVPRNSTFAQSPVLSENDCSGCFYCEFEQMMKKIEENDEHNDNIKLAEDCDHAYTRPNSNGTALTTNPKPIDESLHSENATSTHNTITSTQANFEEGVPFYAFNLGDNIILMPYSQPSFQTPSKSLEEVEKNKTAQSNRSQKTCEVVKKKKRKRKISTPKRYNFKNLCKDQLRFTKILRLHPIKQITKSTVCDITGISEVMRQLGCGKSVPSRFYVPLLQVDRDFDDVYTHISTTACMTVYNGTDAMLKRWNDFDDYPVRLSKDTISGAITDFEVDAVPKGLYTITNTGKSIYEGGVCKNMAILSSVIPSIDTILNNSLLLAVGPINNLSKTNLDLPATIQKHRNVTYLLNSIENLINQPLQDSVVSDKDYRPKSDSPNWYTAKRFDAFTRLYHQQRTNITPMEKLTGNLFTSL